MRFNTPLSRGNLLALAALVVVLPACRKQQPPAPTPGAAPVMAPATPEQPPAEAPELTAWETPIDSGESELTIDIINTGGFLKSVFFDYDQDEIRADQRPTLQANAAWLRDNAGVRVQIAGHCDERGTREYNLALGDRRANAVRDYLVSLGIPAARVATISYGEERPASPGANERVWSQNRRGEFVATAVTSNN